MNGKSLLQTQNVDFPDYLYEYKRYGNNLAHPLQAKGISSMTGLFDIEQLKQESKFEIIATKLSITGDFPYWHDARIDLQFAELNGKGFWTRMYIHDGETSRRRKVSGRLLEELLLPFEIPAQQPEGLYYLLKGECKLAPRFNSEEALPLLKYQGYLMSREYPERPSFNECERTLYQLKDSIIEESTTRFPYCVDESGKGYGFVRKVTVWEDENDFLFIFPFTVKDQSDHYLYGDYFVTKNHPCARQSMRITEILDERVNHSATIPPTGTVLFDIRNKEYLIVSDGSSSQRSNSYHVRARSELKGHQEAIDIYLCDRFDIVQKTKRIDGYIVSTGDLGFFKLQEERPEGFIARPLWSHKDARLIERNESLQANIDIPTLLKEGQERVKSSKIANLFYLFLHNYCYLGDIAYVWIGLATDDQLFSIMEGFYLNLRKSNRDSDAAKNYLRNEMLSWIGSRSPIPETRQR